MRKSVEKVLLVSTVETEFQFLRGKSEFQLH